MQGPQGPDNENLGVSCDFFPDNFPVEMAFVLVSSPNIEIGWMNKMTFLAIVAVFIAGFMLWTRKLSRDATAAVPQVGALHPVKGGAIHYLDLGSKDALTLVMIHGLAGTLQHFTYAVSDLLKDDFRLIIVDRPGAGYSVRDNESDAGLNLQAQMIGEFLDDLGIDNPTVVGHSLGGAVALAMALDRPEKTAALALIAPLTHSPKETPAIFAGLNIKSSALRRILAHTIAGPIAKITTKKFMTEAFAPESCPVDFVERSGAALGLRPKGFIGASADFTAKDSEPTQDKRYGAELKTPGGLLFGRDDVLLIASEQGPVMEQYGLSYEEMEGRGHMLPFTAPEETAAFIRRMAKIGT